MGKISAAYFNHIFTAARAWIGSKRFSIYLYCLAIATFIWFLMKFSGSFTSQLPVQLHYIPPSEEWYVHNKEPVLMVDVQGFGFSLMWRKITGQSNIDVNLSNFEIRGEKSDPFMIVTTEYLLSEVGKLFHEEETIKGLFPNILKVDLSRVVSKEVLVNSRVTFISKSGFKLSKENVVEPSIVKLIGPEYILSKIDLINTKIDTIRDIKDDLVLKVSLDIDSIIDWIPNTQEVLLKVNVDELTSGSILIPIIPRVNDTRTIVKVLPTKVKVYYQVGLDDYALVDENLFEAYVSLPIEGELPEKLKVGIANIPDFVEITRIEPARVEFLLSKPKE
jgi:hypothetical protein